MFIFDNNDYQICFGSNISDEDLSIMEQIDEYEIEVKEV